MPPGDYTRLLEAWEAGQETPADIASILDADEEAVALLRDCSQLGWLLFLASYGGVPSEHYWYKELGRVKPPRSWGL